MTQTSPVILITGGTGFAGSHLTEYLLKHDKGEVHVTSYGSETDFAKKQLDSEHVHQIDLTNYDDTLQLLKEIQPDHIYHLAALAAVGSSFDKLNRVLNINTQLQLSVLAAVTQVCPDARMLTIGSALEYQPQNRPLKESDPLGPVSPYGVSKVTQDMLAFSFSKQHDLDIVRARSFNHIGERQAPGFVVPDFSLQIARIEQGKQDKIKVGNLQAIRDFSDVKDVVRAYALLMEKGKTGQVYNVGSGHGYKIQEILNLLISFAKTDIEIEQDKHRLRPIDVKQVVANNNKIKQLGWEPTASFNETLKRTLDYYRQRI